MNPTLTEVLIERLARAEARQDRTEADLTTLAEYGTLDLSDRDDALGRLDRELREHAGAFEIGPVPGLVLCEPRPSIGERRAAELMERCAEWEI